jgi:WD40 repeat protein
VAFSPDGTTLAGSVGKTIKLWNVATGEERAILKVHINSAVSVIPAD